MCPCAKEAPASTDAALHAVQACWPACSSTVLNCAVSLIFPNSHPEAIHKIWLYPSPNSPTGFLRFTSNQTWGCICISAQTKNHLLLTSRAKKSSDHNPFFHKRGLFQVFQPVHSSESASLERLWFFGSSPLSFHQPWEENTEGVRTKSGCFSSSRGGKR